MINEILNAVENIIRVTGIVSRLKVYPMLTIKLTVQHN